MVKGTLLIIKVNVNSGLTLHCIHNILTLGDLEMHVIGDCIFASSLIGRI